jgi:hypothetical protein
VDRSVSAHFVEISPPEYSLTIEIVGEGTVTRDPDSAKYPSGQQVMLTAEPTSGWIFERWEGGLAGMDNPAGIVMDADRTVKAVFMEAPRPEEVLDQYQEMHSYALIHNYGSFRMAQTFTPGVSGDLTKLDIYGRRYHISSPEMDVLVYPTSGGRPQTGGAPLAAGTLNLGTNIDWYTAEFSSPAHLDEGVTYAMVFHTATGYGNFLYLQVSDSYQGGGYFLSMNSGSSWYVYNYDLAFRTYMVPAGPHNHEEPNIKIIAQEIQTPADTDVKMEVAPSTDWRSRAPTILLILLALALVAAPVVIIRYKRRKIGNSGFG